MRHETDGPEAAAAAAGVHRLRIPTPFAVGTVNVFLIEDDPVVLVDTGPASIQALEALEQQLTSLGYALEDIGLLLVTHQHVDHLGLARRVARASGAEAACLDLLAGYANEFEARAAADDELAAELMVRHGVAEDTVKILKKVASLTRQWGTSFETSRPLAPSSAITLRGRSLRVIHAPGHSPTDTLFVDEPRRILFAGDHLLATISSIALVSEMSAGCQSTAPLVRRRALVEYLQTLRTTRELDVEIVLGGHGPAFTDHRVLIDKRIAEHEARAERILSIVREKPRSAHRIAEAIWGPVAVTEAFMTLSEVLGHLDLLLDAGVVMEQSGSHGEITFAPA